MRRRLVLLAAALLVPLAACGSGGSPAAAPTNVVTTAAANQLPHVTGAFGTDPAITIPTGVNPPGDITSVTLSQGSGPAVANGDLLTLNYTGVLWRTGKAFDSSYEPAFKHTTPFSFVVGEGDVITGWDKGLLGKTAGSRVLLSVPPAAGYGSQGLPSAGIQGDDTLVFVVDIISATTNLPPGQTTQPVGDPKLPQVTGASDAYPTVTVPSGVAPPTQLVEKTLITGTGPVVAAGDRVAVSYTAVNWRTGQVFDSSQTDGVLSATVGQNQLISSWDTGIVGQHVGSRVLLVAPPAQAFGTAGVPAAGVQPTDTVVFVLDILTADVAGAG